MSNIVAFLEAVGADAELRDVQGDAFASLLGAASVAQDLKAALAAGDRTAVQDLSGRATTVCCALAPGRKDDDKEEQPSRDDDEVSAQQRVAA